MMRSGGLFVVVVACFYFYSLARPLDRKARSSQGPEVNKGRERRNEERRMTQFRAE